MFRLSDTKLTFCHANIIRNLAILFCKRERQKELQINEPTMTPQKISSMIRREWQALNAYRQDVYAESAREIEIKKQGKKTKALVEEKSVRRSFLRAVEESLATDIKKESYSNLSDHQSDLCGIAEALVTRGNGILAADENIVTMGKWLKNIGVENSDDNRRQYRQLLFTADKSMDGYISGVILFHESLSQKTDDGINFVTLLEKRGIIPGIKVDTGVVNVIGPQEESTMQGLENLGTRCQEYRKLGCRFAKWRCVLKIGEKTPSPLAILENAIVLARYAVECQKYGIVPILAPEILTEGDHDLERCRVETENVLVTLYKILHDYDVFLEGTLLMINMVTPGQTCSNMYDLHDIAKATITALQHSVPVAIPGITFLSGGQSEEEASIYLNALNKYKGRKPWPLTFSYGRALQESALKAWAGKPENVKAGQDEFLKRAKANSEASMGKYSGGVVGVSAAETPIIDKQSAPGISTTVTPIPIVGSSPTVDEIWCMEEDTVVILD